MPTEEELEQRITDSLDDKEQELKNARAVIRTAERLNEILNNEVIP